MKSLSNNSLPFKLCYVKYSNRHILYIRHKLKKSFFSKEKVFYKMRVVRYKLQNHGRMQQESQ